MNGINDETYELKFTQTAKGMFYIHKVGVTSATKEKTLSETILLMDKAVEMLKKLNEPQNQ